MFRRPVKIGVIEAVAGAPKQIEIPRDLGTVTYLMFLPKNGVNPAASIDVVKNAISSFQLTAAPKNGMSFDIIKPVSPELLYHREDRYSAVLGVTNSADILTYDPSAMLAVSTEYQRYLDIGTTDLSKLTLEVVFKAAIAGLTGIEVWAEFDPIAAPLGAHVRIGSVSAKVPATGGEIEVTTLPMAQDGSFHYQTINIYTPANMSISKVSFTVNSDKDEYRDVPTAVIQRLNMMAGLKPVPGVLTIAFSKEAMAQYFLNGNMQSFKLKPTFTVSAGAVASDILINYELLYPMTKG